MFARNLVVGVGVVGLVLLLGSLSPAVGQVAGGAPAVQELDDGSVLIDGLKFGSWNEYVNSDYFRERGGRCGTISQYRSSDDDLETRGNPSDCTYSYTNPAGEYDPSTNKYLIPVVVHVIRTNSGTTGHISEAMVQSQVDILNEDFLAMAGTNGEDGTDIQIEFYLATEDPGGSPTNGITYSNNTTWYNDNGSYWNSLAWDTNRYLNIYTNSADGYLGYVPDLPQGGIAGSNEDRVVILWEAFGRNAPIGSPYNQGRTTTHEVGHYLGLEHTFTGGCAGGSCYSNGDLICDTNRQADPTWGCSDPHSCSSSDPIHNYMDYSDDLCMEEFTPEQARRIRCSLEHYRPDVYTTESAEDCPNPGVSGNFCTTDVYPNDGDGAWEVGIDGDCIVDMGDLGELLASYGVTSGATREDGDVYPVGGGDGAVDMSDLGELLAQYNDDCS